MVSRKRDVVRIAIVGGLVHREQVRKSLRRGAGGHHVGPDHGFNVELNIELLQAVQHDQTKAALLLQTRDINEGQLDTAIGVLGLGQVLFGLGHVGSVGRQLRVVTQDAVGQRANHQVSVTSGIQNTLVVGGIGDGLAQLQVRHRAVPGVELDRKRAVLGLNHPNHAGFVLEGVHVFAGQVHRNVGFTALHQQALRCRLAHDAPDHPGQVATPFVPAVRHTFDFIQVPGFSTAHLEGARTGHLGAQIRLPIVSASIGFNVRFRDDPDPRQHLQKGGKRLEQVKANGAGIDRRHAVGADHALNHPGIAFVQPDRTLEGIHHIISGDGFAVLKFG